MLGNALMNDGKHSEASKAYQEAVRINANEQTYGVLGFSLLKAGQLVEAASALRRHQAES